MKRLVPLAVALVALAVVAAGCGSKKSSTSTSSTPPPQPTTSTSSGTSSGGGGAGSGAFRVGLSTDIGGLNDRSFNHLAYLGLQRAAKQLGVQTRVVQSNSPADYIPNLASLARQGYDLIIGVGFTEIDAMKAVAKQFPKSHFAIVDVANADEGGLKNVEGLLFKEQEAGAKAADPGVQTLNGYSQDFEKQNKCKEIALNQIQGGSVVVFQVAGGCGLGALDAAKEKAVWGVGVDADQGYLGSYVLTSALKRVDTAVFDSIKDAKAGNFKGGQDAVYGIDVDGVGIGKFSPKTPAGIEAKVAKIEKQLKAGKIANIPTTVK